MVSLARPGKASDYLSRFYRVRELNVQADRLSPPYVWDRKRVTMRPYVNDEWVQLPSGLLVPAIRGGAATTLVPGGAFIFPNGNLGGGPGQSTLALDSAYTYNSAGDAVAWRVMPLPGAKTLMAAYFYITAVTGTAANVNDINFELRPDGVTVGLKPGTTLSSSTSMDPNGDATFVGWHKLDPSDWTIGQSVMYWVVIADADGNGTDFATVLIGLSNTISAGPGAYFQRQYTTSDGFVSTPSSIDNCSALVLEFTDGTVWGSSYATTSSPTSNTERKGWRIGGFTERISLVGLAWRAAGANSGIELYADDGTPPGGATLASYDFGQMATPGGTTFQAAFLSSPYNLEKATAYGFVLKFPSTVAVPQKLNIGAANGHSTVLRKARPGGTGWHYRQANGTSNWNNDDQDAQPQANLILEDQVEVAPAAIVLGTSVPRRFGG